MTGGCGPLTAFECEAVEMVSVGGRGARGVGGVRTAIRAIGSGRLLSSVASPSGTLSARLIPSRIARLARSGSAAASAAMCLSIVCLGAGLAQASREPTDAFLTRQAIAQSPRIPISVFADEEVQPDEVAQADHGDAVVPPVKRQRPVTPPDTPSAMPAAPQASPPPAPPQEATPAAGTAHEQPEPSPAEPTKQNAEDVKPAAPPAAAEKESAQTPHDPDRSSPIFPEMGGIFAPITDWLASANRDYQNTVVKELSRPSDGAAQEQSDQAAKEAKDAQAAKEASQAQAAREREAAAKAQAAARAEAEAKAKAAAQAQAARAAAEAEAARRAQQAAQSKAQKPAEESADQAAARARQAEEQRQAEAARHAEQARKDEEDRKAREEAEASKLREAARMAEERRKQLAEEEARKAEAAKAARLADQERRAAAEAEQSAARAVAPNQTGDQTEADGSGPASRHRRWAVVITAEPLGQSYAEPAAGVLIANQRLAPRMGVGAGSLRGTRVRGWSWHPGRCRFAGRRVQRLPGRYTVAKGDSLWRISQKHYYKGRLYTRIYRANRRKIADPDLIYPCQKFWVPRR